ncbi:hypothetical protein A3B57_03340 [Microgenomates group bacterium RIFCSPLOWO2_01_FULL_47_10]|nr:MAG: hypothetical protein A3B57_03340 [Microgenomates group bacterium RIFCSPLOWO2_01_FULL_47_10]
MSEELPEGVDLGNLGKFQADPTMDDKMRDRAAEAPIQSGSVGNSSVNETHPVVKKGLKTSGMSDQDIAKLAVQNYEGLTSNIAPQGGAKLVASSESDAAKRKGIQSS